jgi:hypothetical protein
MAKGRCGTCYAYWRRRGADRPFELMARLTERDIVRELERQARRARGWDPNV